MSWPKFVLSLVAISTVCACTAKKKAAKVEACQTAHDTSLAPDRIVSRQTIQMHGSRQRVIRKNCAGVVRSDKIESQEATYKDGVTVDPKGQFAEAEAHGYNRTTCNTADTSSIGKALTEIFSLFGSKSRPFFQFTPHTSPTFLGGGHVKKNADNYIDYEFDRCVQKSEDGKSCLKSETLEKGTLILTVQYSESFIDQPQELQDACPSK
jgi:hypothetical protein